MLQFSRYQSGLQILCPECGLHVKWPPLSFLATWWTSQFGPYQFLEHILLPFTVYSCCPMESFLALQFTVQFSPNQFSKYSLVPVPF